LSLYTEWYWQIDLHNLFRFLKLRLDPHAQKEIQLYARVMLEIAGKVCPLACGSFRKHQLEGRSFSGPELSALRNLTEGRPSGLSGKEELRFRQKLEERS
jgi:thymidylate synthase (FAD)